MIFNLTFVEKWLQFNALNDFSVWLRTSSNPADTYQCRSHIGIRIDSRFSTLVTKDQILRATKILDDSRCV